MDEHRVGLKPIVGRVWAERGRSPSVAVQHRYQWLYLYAFTSPQTGEGQYWLLPSVSTEAFQAVLESVAISTSAGQKREIILVLDGAGWHTTPLLRCPDGITLVFLPPYSPELQPAERLWQLTDAPLKNRHFRNVDAALEDPRRTVLLAGKTTGSGQSIDRFPLVAKDNELIGIRITGHCDTGFRLHGEDAGAGAAALGSPHSHRQSACG